MIKKFELFLEELYAEFSHPRKITMAGFIGGIAEKTKKETGSNLSPFACLSQIRGHDIAVSSG